MKKEIKFRIYNQEAKKMVESGGTPMMLKGFFEHTAVLHTRDEMPYLQFTGLLDRNGKEIYEGDVVKVLWGNCKYFIGGAVFTMEVVYEKTWFALKEKYSGIIKPMYDLQPQPCDIHGESETIENSYEIIGNIYEHGHLLE